MQNRLIKLVTVAALVVAVMAFGLMGGLAHEQEAQTFMIHAGAHAPGNVEALVFAPAVVQVHQGDTVMWHITNLHNVHFGDNPVELVIMPEVNGQIVPQINPAGAFPSIENGGVYTGGDVNSGLPQGALLTTFSLVIDAPVGRYMYFCDVHPGMVGVIEVVADDVAIPSPGEVDAQAAQEIDGHLLAGAAAQPAMLGDVLGESVEGVLNVAAGSENIGRTTLNLFSPAVGVIAAGETVTWTNPAGSIEPHFVNIAPYDPVAVPETIPQMVEGGPPVLALGPGLLGDITSGAEIGLGDSFNSSFIVPGQSFSLTFTEAGVYNYECHIHPNMKGVIVVE